MKHHNRYAAKYFSSKVLRGLHANGVRLTEVIYLPGDNFEREYAIDNRGIRQQVDHAAIFALAKGTTNG